MKTKLPTSVWVHAILHVAALIRLRSINYHNFFSITMALGQQPNISHMEIFGCAFYVPIGPSQCTKMGLQRRLGIYIGFDRALLFATLSH